MIFGVLVISVSSLYFFYLLLLRVSWKANPFFKPKEEQYLPVTIIIPCRNEEKTIATCLESIGAQHYPARYMEVLVVDDHSEDQTVEIAKQHPFVKVLSLPQDLKGKKNALSFAIRQAAHECIITRDADTTSGPEWLSTIVAAQTETKAALLICPVKLNRRFSLLNSLQRLEHFALTILTGGMAFLKKPILCNGANLCFTKTVFNEVNGFAGNENIASGDDIFLLNKIREIKPAGIFFLKNRDAFVCTDTPAGPRAVMQQRLRWTQKNRKNPDFLNAFSGLLIVFCNVFTLSSGILSVFYPELTPYFIFTAIQKCIIDFLLLFLAASFYQQRTVLLAFPVMAIVYPFYTLWMFIAAYTARAEWKGRNIN
jgi:cellulose synthase/poly-beta-1,6-N-acetylglucosamine synthase-like glycosyltransferase